MKMISRFVGWIFTVTILSCGFSVLYAAEKPFSVPYEEDKIFEYRTFYPFWEQRYSPRVSFQVLDKKYDEAQYTNPYPEELATFIISAMKRDDYEHWLGLWTVQSQEVIKAKDSTGMLIENRKAKWRKMFAAENEVFLTTLVHVGEAQYTYVMAIFEIVKKENPNASVYTLYIPMMIGEDGKWYAARELSGHPVLKRYIEGARVYYKSSNPGAKP